MLFDQDVANILSGNCLMNAGYLLSKFLFYLFFVIFLVSPKKYYTKHLTLDLLLSITIHSDLDGVASLDGRRRQLLFALHEHNCCRWKEELSDKQIALLAPAAAGRKH